MRGVKTTMLAVVFMPWSQRSVAPMRRSTDANLQFVVAAITARLEKQVSTNAAAAVEANPEADL